MLEYLSVILKAHAVNGVNLAVETIVDMSPSVQRDMHDTLTMNIFQSILLKHEIALSVKVTCLLLDYHTTVTFHSMFVEL